MLLIAALLFVTFLMKKHAEFHRRGAEGAEAGKRFT
jgi:hypothetical protein